MSTRTYQRWAPKHWDEYSLLDSGHGARLEKFGKLTLDRPDPSVVWSRGRNNLEWRDADSRFEPTSRTKGNWSPAEIRPKGLANQLQIAEAATPVPFGDDQLQARGYFSRTSGQLGIHRGQRTGRAKIPEPLCLHRWRIARSLARQELT